MTLPPIVAVADAIQIHSMDVASNDPALRPAMLSVRISDAMRLTGIGKTKMFELIANGTLETTLVGRRRLILYASLEDLILNRRTKG